MPVIEMSLFIQAPIQRCFDLSRSIDIHMESTSKTQEKAIAGRTSGLIELNETVTWEAVHLGVRQRLSVRITEMEAPHRFVDEMVSGAFQRFTHVHEFIPHESGTLMKDRFDYTSPLGPLGRLADWLFLKSYMTRFLHERNEYIKAVAERQE
ncbi:SRPBCC family protein [Paenibacillus sp. OAS669]|uniref:SRPBCC family protein n=1 Tax=Paenibacillus sp. OAS669 TaxID=2663821 RepID=UPI00178A30B9|nr:SRPBCC family protein [Paenibacillus sp. OAS669]MBE1447111.1 ligand-binding SRPBCC domain-containing protein [Paenibacillus sp. OAS669]